MAADCHMHMILDGYEWKNAISRHAVCPDEAWIREILRIYQQQGQKKRPRMHSSRPVQGLQRIL